MKKTIFITLFILIAISLSAQKEVRKAIRSGNSAYNEQRYGAAEAEYNKALKENAGSKEASFNLANTYYKQQKWDEAVKEYQHYLTLENEDPDKMSSAWSNMGNTFLKKKANEKGQMPVPQGQQPQQPQQQADNLKLSMEAYKNALRLNPKDDQTRYNLAVVQKMIKDQNKDQKQDQNKDQKQDQNKDQNQDQNKDQKQDQNKDQQNQMSQDNMQQILQAIEQDEKNTQERVKQAKAQERKQKNENNRKQNKDW